MKRILLLLNAMIITAVLFAQSGNITNGGFENWTTLTLYENTDDWTTGNRFDQSGPLLTTLKSTDAQDGTYSALIESKLGDAGQDTTFGFVILGDIGDLGPTNGYTYTSTVDTIKGWFKYDIMPGDSATIIVSFFDNGNPVTQDVVLFAGTQNSWTKFAYPINAGLVAPDSVLVGFASSNAFANFALPGSWLMVDNISFASSIGSADPLPNPSFENWSDVTSEEPNNWITYNPQLAQEGFTTTDKTTDANSGNFAVRMETKNLSQFSNDPVPGIITNGPIGQQGPAGGVPYVAQPTTFSGFYKYTAAPSDTGWVAVTFWDNGIPNGFAYQEFTQTVATYTQFTTLVNVPTAPDSMNIFFWSGDSTGSVLILDDIDFSGGNVGVYEFDGNLDRFDIYPNPATDVVTIEFELAEASDISLNIFDATGRLVYHEAYGVQNDGNNRRTINVSHLPTGIYNYQLIANKKAITKKLVVK